MAETPDSEILFYQGDDGDTRVEVRLEGETVWLTAQQIAQLFGTTRQNIDQHIRNIYDEEELTESATCKKFLQVRQEGNRQVRRELPHYNLDMILSVGYRVKSATATRFRQWASERLTEYIVKGFTMDDERMKELGGGRYWRELLDRIRDIRSSEKVLYRQVLDLFATSVDYKPQAPEAKEFFAKIQNKLHHAAHGHTAPEVILERADAEKPFMGLTTFKGDKPVRTDVTVAKNYLTEDELRRLNTVVSAYFDAAEFRAMNREPTYMADWLNHLDGLLTAMGAAVVEGGGSVSRQQADDKAYGEYTKYRAAESEELTEVERQYLDMLKQTQKRIEGEKK